MHTERSSQCRSHPLALTVDEVLQSRRCLCNNRSRNLFPLQNRQHVRTQHCMYNEHVRIHRTCTWKEHMTKALRQVSADVSRSEYEDHYVFVGASSCSLPLADESLAFQVSMTFATIFAFSRLTHEFRLTSTAGSVILLRF